MKILITGGKGMLGRTLQKKFATGNELFVADLPEVNILNPESLKAAFSEFKPDAVIHCAAMTKVDDCETNEEAAFRLNGMGSANVARACAECGARLIAVSTDYVFSGDVRQKEMFAKSMSSSRTIENAEPTGESPEKGWIETEPTFPCTVYGKSKLAGERSALDIKSDAVVLRIAWLYGEGGPSFVHTMMKLGSQEGAPLKVVDDQRGNPTSADVVANEIEFILSHPEIKGVVHGTCEGICSWYELTKEIFRLKGFNREVVPCTTDEYPRPAPRPAFSALENTVLESSGFRSPHWRTALADFLSAGDLN